MRDQLGNFWSDAPRSGFTSMPYTRPLPWVTRYPARTPCHLTLPRCSELGSLMGSVLTSSPPIPSGPLLPGLPPILSAHPTDTEEPPGTTVRNRPKRGRLCWAMYPGFGEHLSPKLGASSSLVHFKTQPYLNLGTVQFSDSLASSFSCYCFLLFYYSRYPAFLS